MMAKLPRNGYGKVDLPALRAYPLGIADIIE